jgi:hypothetical protein
MIFHVEHFKNLKDVFLVFSRGTFTQYTSSSILVLLLYLVILVFILYYL